VIARLICRFRGHQPPFSFFDLTATIPGVTVTTECLRCHGPVEQVARVVGGAGLRLVKPKDAA
jgi:hypothetical protein